MSLPSNGRNQMRVKVDGKFKDYRDIKKQRGVVLPLVQEYLLAHWGEDDRPQNVVHSSEMSKPDWCIRATAYRLQSGMVGGTPDKFNFILQNIYSEGDEIHAKWQRWLTDTGKLWGDWRCIVCGERAPGQLVPNPWMNPCEHYVSVGRSPHIWKYEEVNLHHGIISGHEDAAIGDHLVEFKSIGIGTLRKGNPDLLKKHAVQTKAGKTIYDLERVWQGVRSPFRSHVIQTNIYLWLARQMDLPFKRASIVYEHKYDQRT